MAEAGGAAQEALGGVAAPGSPRCACEIGRQEAAAENPGAGNGHCARPTPLRSAGPPAPLPPMAGATWGCSESPGLSLLGSWGARGLPPTGSSSSSGEAAVPSGHVGAAGVRMEPGPRSWMGFEEEGAWGN